MSGEWLETAHKIVDALEEKKGEDIVLLDLIEVSTFTDYFVICSAASERTLQALAEEVERRVRMPRGEPGPRREGSAASGWLLLDFGGVILHLFSPETRAYYRLEELWREGRVLLRVQ